MATLRFPLPNGKVFAREFTRGALEALIRPVVDRTMAPVKQALADAQLKPSDLDEVVLVGGTTRTPLIRRTVQEFFDRKPHTELNPDEVVAWQRHHLFLYKARLRPGWRRIPE